MPDGPRGGWPIRLNVPADVVVKSIPLQSLPSPPVSEHKHWYAPERIPPAR